MSHLLAHLTMMTVTPPPPAGGKGGSASSTAIIALVCGILSWFLLPLIAAVIGAILGKMEMNAIKAGRSPQAGETFATIGFYLSVANIAFAVVGTCASIAFVVLVWAGLIGAIGGLGIFSEILNSVAQ